MLAWALRGLYRLQARPTRFFSLRRGLLGALAGFWAGRTFADREELEHAARPFLSENELLARIDRTRKPAFLVFYVPGSRAFFDDRRKWLRVAEEFRELA